MKAIFLTDMHGRLQHLAQLPPAELLLVGGDITHFGPPAAVGDFLALARSRYSALLAVLGNCDPPDATSALQNSGAGLQLMSRVAGGFLFFGIGGSNRTPNHTPNEWDDAAHEAVLAARLAALAGLPETPERRVLITHAPPFGSGAGLLPGGHDAGSRAVAEFARQFRPALILCGHIHEAQGIFTWEGRTVVNPGPFRDGHYARVEFLGGQVPGVSLARLR